MTKRGFTVPEDPEIAEMLEELKSYIAHAYQVKDPVFEQMTGQTELARDFVRLVSAQGLLSWQILTTPDAIVGPGHHSPRRRFEAAETVTIAALINVFFGRHPELIDAMHLAKKENMDDMLKGIFKNDD